MKFVAICISIISVGVAALLWTTRERTLPASEPSASFATPTPRREDPPSVTVNGDTIHYSFFRTAASTLQLIPNFSEKKSSGEIISEQGCRAGINGGFYDTQNRPLGLFTIGNTVLRNKSDSMLINGFIGITSDDTPFISHQLATNSAKFIFQTGPLLIINGQPLPLAIKNDEQARRMVAAVDANGTIIFLSLYNSDSVFDGPLLGEVPALITKINQKELLNIVDAINLDGGSASAFYNETVTLSELTSIGSFFCIKTL